MMTVFFGTFGIRVVHAGSKAQLVAVRSAEFADAGTEGSVRPMLALPTIEARSPTNRIDQGSHYQAYPSTRHFFISVSQCCPLYLKDMIRDGSISHFALRGTNAKGTVVV